MVTAALQAPVAGSKDEAYWVEMDGYRPFDHPMVRAFTEPRIRTMCHTIGAGRDKRLLDAGTGPGAFMCSLDRFYDVYGIDTSPHMLSKNPLKDKCRCLDASNTGLPDASYDIVFEANMLHHVDDPVATVREMSRLSSEWLVLLEPNRLNPVMMALAVLRKEERTVLKSSRRFVRDLVKPPFEIVHMETAGMIAPNRIPLALLPVLRPFDFSFPLGMFHFLIARRTEAPKHTYER